MSKSRNPIHKFTKQKYTTKKDCSSKKKIKLHTLRLT